MAKPTGPLLSLDASGTLADTITFSKWRGVSYARQRVIPSNPQSSEQTLTRNVFKWTSDMWRTAPSLARAPWTAFAQGQPYTDRNQFIGKNTESLRSLTDLSAFIGSPGAKGGIATTSIALTPGSNQIAVAFTNPAAPTGWTLQSAIAAAIRDQDPQTELLDTWTVDEDDTTQNSVTLTGLVATELYYVAAWLRWVKPDGTIAYGPSVLDSATPTV